MDKWNELIALRDTVNQCLEEARGAKLIGKPLEAKVTMYMDDELCTKYSDKTKLLETLFIVSKVEIVNGKGGKTYGDERVGAEVARAEGEKCERCWIYSDTVGKDPKHPTLCERCAKVVD